MHKCTKIVQLFYQFNENRYENKCLRHYKTDCLQSEKHNTMTHNEKHREAERRRLDGEKPTKAQINQTLISRRQSKKVLEEIKQAMLPKL